MKKLLGIVVLGLLVGCASTAYEARDGNGKLKIRTDIRANSTFAEIKAVSDRFCQSENRGNSINLRKINKSFLRTIVDGSEDYEFDCDK